MLDSIREDVPADDACAQERRIARAGGGAAPGESWISVRAWNSCADFRALFRRYRDEYVERSAADAGGGSSAFLRRVPAMFSRRANVAVMPIRAQGPGRRVFPGRLRRRLRWSLWVLRCAPMLDRVLAPSGPRATVASVDGEIYRVSDQRVDGARCGRRDWRERRDSHGQGFARGVAVARRVDWSRWRSAAILRLPNGGAARRFAWNAAR